MRQLLTACLALVLILTACTGGLEENYQPPSEVQAAFDAALVYVRNTYPDEAPPVDLEWSGANITPEDVDGGVTYRFESGEWTIDLSHAVVQPEDIRYSIYMENTATGFTWEGYVDPAGAVTEQ